MFTRSGKKGFIKRNVWYFCEDLLDFSIQFRRFSLSLLLRVPVQFSQAI